MANLGVIAQNFDVYDGDGLDPFARTGSISLAHLYKAGAQGVIVGHSEVGDEPQVVNKKLRSIIKIEREWGKRIFERVVVLVGENWGEFKGNTAEEVAGLVVEKCGQVFHEIPREFLSKVFLGYEPKWGSRGSGKDDAPAPNPEQISLCAKEMLRFVGEMCGENTIPHFIYGGRSTPERTLEILKDENVNGLILGSACNTVKKTLDIANSMDKVCKREKILVCNFKAYDLRDSYKEYVSELGRLPDDFEVLLAPAYTNIKRVREEVGLKVC